MGPDLSVRSSRVTALFDAELFGRQCCCRTALRRTLMDTCRDPAATEDPILVFDAFGPIGFVMKFAADDWEW